MVGSVLAILPVLFYPSVDPDLQQPDLQHDGQDPGMKLMGLFPNTWWRWSGTKELTGIIKRCYHSRQYNALPGYDTRSFVLQFIDGVVRITITPPSYDLPSSYSITGWASVHSSSKII